MARRPSPCAHNSSSVGSKTYTDFSANIDLADGAPQDGTAARIGLAGFKYCAGRLRILGTGTAGALVFASPDGTTTSIPIPTETQPQPFEIDNVSFGQLIASGTSQVASVTAFWYQSGML